MQKRIVVLGSTGSIGRQTLEVVAALGDRIRILALAAGSNTDLLLEQAARYGPAYVCGAALSPDDPRLAASGYKLLAMTELATLPEADIVVVATVGRVGLAPTMAAIRAGKTVAIANKEVLVVAGELLADAARASGATILPIDSEHCAIWQCLIGEGQTELGVAPADVTRIILTASGGPFRDLGRAALARVTARQALDHPTWQMGKKITIDSATLMNKGLEVVEARWLFGVPYHRIEVVLHRESVVHSMVEFVDGSLKAQLGVPDMRLPIQYALTYPLRSPSAWPRLVVTKLGQLSFGPIDDEKFPCLRLARQAGERGGTYPAALSAADEVAVEAFLDGQINFLQIPFLIEQVLERHHNDPRPTMDSVLAADRWARRVCRDLVTEAI